MQDGTKSTLTALVEEHVTSLVREAACVERHSKRARFHRGDVISSNTGISGGEGGVIRRRLHHDDVNLALQWRGSERLYTTNAGALPPHAVNPTGAPVPADRGRDRIDLNSYVRSEMTIRPPSEAGLTLHWLAVDGKQPAVPQNIAAAAYGGRVVHRIEDYDGDEVDEATAADPDAAAAEVQVQALRRRLLSEELQLYFTGVTQALEKGTPAEAAAALSSVASDAGTQELVPFFARFVAQRLKSCLGQTERCRTIVRLFDALLSNPHLHLELHLDRMIPQVGSCIVARNLSSSPFEDHWSLREEAARSLVKMCNIYGDQYATLKTRVVQTLASSALRPDRPLTTQYGGIVGVSLFGPKTIDAFILPLARESYEKWESALVAETDMEKRFEIHMCQQALLNAIGVFVRSVSLEEQSKRLDAESFSDVFGEKLVPLQPEQTAYTSSVL